MSYKANQEKLEINSSGVLNAANVPTTVPADGSITTAKLADGAVTGIKRTNAVLGRTQITNGIKTNGDSFSVSAVCVGNPVKICFEPRPGTGLSYITATAPNGQTNSLAYFVLVRNGTTIGHLGSLGLFFGTVISGSRSANYSPGSFEFIDQSPPTQTNVYQVGLLTSSDTAETYDFAAVDLVVREI